MSAILQRGDSINLSTGVVERHNPVKAVDDIYRQRLQRNDPHAFIYFVAISKRNK